MTERERWIVYPLLFLALGAALRDKLVDQTISKRIGCQELVVYGEGNGQAEPPRLVVIGADRTSPGAPQAGIIVVDGQLRANEVYANGYVYQGVPLGIALLRAMPDWLRAIQQSAENLQKSREAAGGKFPQGAAAAPMSEAPNNSSTSEQPAVEPSAPQR